MCKQVFGTAMQLVRTMMALAIALSVAMLPAAGSAMFIATPQAAAEAMADDMAMVSDMSGAMECRPYHATPKPCDHPSGQCPMAFCAAQPVNLAFAAAYGFDLPMVAGTPLPIPTDQVVALHGSSLPFRPPRV
jgi:hypothetical protein